MRSAVLLLIFKRPSCVRQVMGALREAAPPRLYIAADGPRPDQPGEAALCDLARQEALKISWPCEVKTLFRDRNMGGPLGIPDALNWFFAHEPEGIILEDDTVPVRGFFRFCDYLLEYYRERPQVMLIRGNNFNIGLRYGNASYQFSNLSICWGWATWRRAWQCHAEYVDLPGLDSFLENQLPQLVHPASIPWWRFAFTHMRNSPPGHWDLKFQYAIWQRGGLCVRPRVNMVRNIGWGDDAQHLRSPFIWMHLKTRGLRRITHPDTVKINSEADSAETRLFYFVFLGNSHRKIDAAIREAFLRLRTGEFGGLVAMLGLMKRFYGMRSLLKGFNTALHNLQLIVRPGQEVLFDESGQGSRFLAGGWSTPEHWGVWSDGSFAQIRFHLRPRPISKVVLRFQLLAFIPLESSVREIDVAIGNKLIDRWRFDAATSSVGKSLIVTQEEIGSGGLLEIGFNVLKPESPFEFGLAPDGRKLGIGLVSLVVDAEAPRDLIEQLNASAHS